ncbi:alpha-ketoacid dehydrogenase subunit beta [Candidatus Peregrinibacteria bacterium]|nr:alpha-ketoacid dehydrogenase subunit beta [Candidatus Peregrinibacteria bacterium]
MKTNVHTMVSALNEGLRQEMKRDSSVLLYGEDVGKVGGVFRVTQGIQKEFGEKRCFDSPLAEAGIIGTAIGLAINGMKPVVEMQFSGFFYEGFAQVYCHAARMRNRSRGRFTVPMVIRMPFAGGIRALEHHSESTEAILSHIPGLKVVVASTPFDAKGLITSAIRDPDPVIFMEPKRVYRALKQEVPEQQYSIPIGQAAVLQDGTDLTIFSYGSMLHQVFKAMPKLKEQNISARVVDLRTISPLDTKTILESAEKTGRVVIVQEAARSFGASSEIATLIYENSFGKLKAPIERVTGYDIHMPLLRRENIYLPDETNIMEAVKKVLNK